MQLKMKQLKGKTFYTSSQGKMHLRSTGLGPALFSCENKAPSPNCVSFATTPHLFTQNKTNLSLPFTLLQFRNAAIPAFHKPVHYTRSAADRLSTFHQRCL